MRDREGLVARIRQIRRVAAATDRSTAPAAANADAPVIRTLEERIAHLEQMVEGLQDSVHRESERHEKRIADLEAQIQPGAMGAALDKDARERGL
jgi:vacuolar-type H+-ATPase subunit I/STV1